jgi:hypothetical protein
MPLRLPAKISVLAFRLMWSASLLLALAGCRQTLIYVTPEQPQQGELIYIGVDNEERDQVRRVEVTFAGRTGSSSTVPAYFTGNTCRDTEPYMTSLEIRVVTTYVDGSTGTQTRVVDLTRGLDSREDADRTYDIYITQDSDEDYRDEALGIAGTFMDEFDSYSNAQYVWADPSLYTTACGSYANSADLVISVGHGSPHRFDTGVGQVDLSETGYGNFRPCGAHGDAEYLVFASCQVLSRADIDGQHWRYFWQNYRSTRTELRPFAGLHMVMGFTSNWSTRVYRTHTDGEDMFEDFAANLDSGDRVIDAWLDAVADELDFDDGYNRGAVFYLPEYEDDTIRSAKDDYIYGNPSYSLYAEYFE